MEKDPEQLERKLLENVGWHDFDNIGFAYPPNAKELRFYPVLTQSLDAYLKWLKNPLDAKHKIHSIQFHYDEKRNVDCFVVTDYNEYEGNAGRDKEALALCRAIEKLIDEKDKKATREAKP